MSSHVHVINKANIEDHRVLPYDAPSASLPKGFIKARFKLLSITLTNRDYALHGSFLHWWDAFPVPEDLPAPYNNRDEFGIVCSWGYGEVIESQNDEIAAGTLMYGYWPTSTHPVVLNFKSAGLDGHFTEVSPHRQRLMTVYNHFYTVAEKDLGDKQAWDSTTLTLWSAGHFLAKYPFPTVDETPISPNGITAWDNNDGSLQDALVVVLVASAKTARGFSWNLTQRSSEGDNRPKALLEVSSAPEALPTASASKIDTKGVSYDELSSSDVLDWIKQFSAKRIVLVDFGAPDNVAQSFHDTVYKDISTLGKIDYIHATTSYINTDDPRTKCHQFNTSPMLDAAVKIGGLESVCGGRQAAFDEWLAAKGMGDMELQWGEGIQGDNGIEGAWSKLVKGNLPRRKALVFRV